MKELPKTTLELIKEWLQSEVNSQPDLNNEHDIDNEDDALCYGRKECAKGLLDYINYLEGE